APPDFIAEFYVSGNRVKSLTVERGQSAVDVVRRESGAGPAETRKTRPGNEDLAKFEGLFVSENPPAQIRIRLESGKLIATALHEPGPPSYALVPVSLPDALPICAPPDFIAEFYVSGNRVKSLTVERGQ